MIQPEWKEILSGSSDNWLKWLHLGVMEYEAGDYAAAKQAWEKSLGLKETAWAYRNMAFVHRKEEDIGAAADALLNACSLSSMPKLILECYGALLEAERAPEVLKHLYSQSDELRAKGRMQIMECKAYLQVGDYDRARHILNDLTDLVDIREGESTLTDLWVDTHKVQIERHEEIPDRELRRIVLDIFPLPQHLDFRQSAEPRRRRQGVKS
jgi:tetratricopeptide (TPR) repeat protein